MAKSIPGQLSMWSLMTSEPSPSATSSPGSEGGGSPSDSLDGQTTGQSGPARARANPSAKQVRGSASKTPDTSGQLGSSLLPPADLQSFLESRFLKRFVTGGSTPCAMTLKRKVTPSGRRFFQLVPLERRISATGSGFWPTPRASGGSLSGGSNSRKAALKRGQYLSGKLNPAWIGWLMGYGTEWHLFADLETPSSRKSQRKS